MYSHENVKWYSDNWPIRLDILCMYYLGQGVKKSLKNAAKWYTLAADQGFAPAQNNLGTMYAEGRGVDKDEKHAIELFTLAADQGDAKAQYGLGLMYAEGRGVEKSVSKAKELWTKGSTCPWHGCSEPIPDEVYKELLPQDLFKRYQQYATNNFVDSRNLWACSS